MMTWPLSLSGLQKFAPSARKLPTLFQYTESLAGPPRFIADSVNQLFTPMPNKSDSGVAGPA